MILDVHCHTVEDFKPDSIINADLYSFNPREGQYYSIGLHPWDINRIDADEAMTVVARYASHPSVVAIGETGIDLPKGGALHKQIDIFMQHVNISERLGKPLIIHCVKAHDIISEIRKRISPKMDWIIHGFRNKPSIAKILLDAGCYISYGERFNPESLSITPDDKILAETDTSDCSISQIIDKISAVKGQDIVKSIEKTTDLLFKTAELLH